MHRYCASFDDLVYHDFRGGRRAFDSCLCSSSSIEACFSKLNHCSWRFCCEVARSAAWSA
jgi:hypothetical protein